MNSSVSFTSLQQWDRDAADTVYGNGPPCTNPQITSQPASTTVTSGNSAFLQVTSPNADHYQWYDGVAPDQSTPVGTDSRTFTTPPINTVKHYW